MRQRYQRGCLRCAGRKAGPDRWEFLWRETDETGKRVRRTAIIGTVERYPTRDLAQAAANELRMQVNEDRLRQLEHHSDFGARDEAAALEISKPRDIDKEIILGNNKDAIRWIGFGGDCGEKYAGAAQKFKIQEKQTPSGPFLHPSG